VEAGAVAATTWTTIFRSDLIPFWPASTETSSGILLEAETRRATLTSGGERRIVPALK
jgi:hypothetical protein